MVLEMYLKNTAMSYLKWRINSPALDTPEQSYMTDMVPTSLPGAAAVGGCESTGILGSFGGFAGDFYFRG